MDNEDNLVISKTKFIELMQDIIYAIDHGDTRELSSNVYDLAWDLNNPEENKQ